MEYTKCLVELDEILNYLSVENLEKIPYEIRKSIKEQKDKEYIWKYDDTKELKEQELDRKTIVILSYLNMEYLLNDEQKQFMENLHELNEQNLEKEKQERYNPNNLFKDRTSDTIQEKETRNENVAMLEYKESAFKRFLNKIKTFFSK